MQTSCRHQGTDLKTCVFLILHHVPRAVNINLDISTSIPR